MSRLSERFLIILLSSFVHMACGTFEINTRKESFSVQTTVGKIQCGVMCIKNGRCGAINYNRNNLVCELVETPSVTVSENFGWKHTSDFSFVADHLCALVTVPISFVCVALSSQTTALVKNVCTDALPTPSNAVASTDNIEVGVSVNFSCDGEYFGEGNGTSTCLANGQWSTLDYTCIESAWPDGTYTLLQPFNGCPPGFSTGHRVWYPEHTGQSTFSVDNNLQGYANHSQIAWHFCTKIKAEASDTWPAGNYCILRNGGTCPTGFSSGSITFDEDDSAPSIRPQGTGTLPDGNYNTNSKLYFCCKNDGSVAIQATFPRSAPFILYPYTVASCQLVSDMTDVPGYTFFDSEPNGNIDDSDGSIPYTTNGPPTWYIHHCYYH